MAPLELMVTLNTTNLKCAPVFDSSFSRQLSWQGPRLVVCRAVRSPIHHPGSDAFWPSLLLLRSTLSGSRDCRKRFKAYRLPKECEELLRAPESLIEARSDSEATSQGTLAKRIPGGTTMKWNLKGGVMVSCRVRGSSGFWVSFFFEALDRLRGCSPGGVGANHASSGGATCEGPLHACAAKCWRELSSM